MTKQKGNDVVDVAVWDSLSLWKSGAISFEYMATDCLPFSDFWPDGNHLVTPSMIFNWEFLFLHRILFMF